MPPSWTGQPYLGGPGFLVKAVLVSVGLVQAFSILVAGQAWVAVLVSLEGGGSYFFRNHIC